MMKTSLLPLTVLLMALPLFNIYFNTFTTFTETSIHSFASNSEGKYNTTCEHAKIDAEFISSNNKKMENIAAEHDHCSFIHNCTDASNTDAKIAFGSDLGKALKQSLQYSQSASGNYQIKKVVIDPGHGGRDSGCSSSDAREKKIVLNIAKKLGQSIKSVYPFIEVIYTRQTDIFVPLYKRAEIANKNQADLFISIHCNAMPNTTATYDRIKGSETYVMGLHRASENLAVAKRENAVILLEDSYTQNYGGYDPNSSEAHIMLSMYQNAYLEKSILLAQKIENNVQATPNRKSRGVKQAGFVVLRKTAMPSVLVECGYLTNPQDRQYLNTEFGQQKMSNAIMNAFASYKSEVESSQALATNTAAVISYDHLPAIPNKNEAAVMEEKLITKKAIPSSYDKPVQALETPKKKIQVQYKVQIFTASKLVNTKIAPWTKVKYPVELRVEQDAIKYLARGFESLNEAVAAKMELRSIGFKEAFIVAFNGNKRISVAKAKNLLNQ